MEVTSVFPDGDEVLYATLHLHKKKLEIKAVGTLVETLAPSTKVVSGLDCDEIILRRLTLKLRSRHAIRRVLPFQAEAALPYAPEETVVLPFFSKREGGETGVSLLATTKTLLNDHLARMRSLRLDPDQISCAPSAICSFASHFFPDERELFFLHIGQEKSFCGLILDGKLEQIYAFSLGSQNFSELLMQKELDRALTFLKKRAASSPTKLLLTGRELSGTYPNKIPYEISEDFETNLLNFSEDSIGETTAEEKFRRFGQNGRNIDGNFIRIGSSFNLKSHIEMDLGLSLLEESEMGAFAIPIGLALDGLSRKAPTQFRQGEFTPIKLQNRRTQLSLYALASSLFLTLALIFGGEIISSKKASELKEKLAAFTPAKNASFETLEEGISLCEEALAKEKAPFPLVSTAPKVADLLAWLSSHPLLENEIDLKEVRYDLTKYPKLGGAREPYLAKVELKFTSTTPAAARQLREALMKGDGLVNPKLEVTWNVEQNLYRTSFFLKGIKR
ncbi:MAG: hypothetical protein HYX48_00505 [Chlamydiales bacterium]|nr:hypothetical protein [Chlamydiales bacterium]